MQLQGHKSWLTCSQLHKGKLPLIVDVHVDDTGTCSNTPLTGMQQRCFYRAVCTDKQKGCLQLK